MISKDGQQVSVKVLKLLNNEFNNKNFSRHVIKDENLPLHYSNIKPARREYMENEEIIKYIKDNGLKMSLNGLSNEIFDLFSVRICTNELKKVIEELHSNDTDTKPLSDIYKEHQMNLKKKVKKRVEMMLKHKMLIKKVIIREQFSKVALKPQLLIPVINTVFKEYEKLIEENNKEVMKK